MLPETFKLPAIVIVPLTVPPVLTKMLPTFAALKAACVKA